MAGMLNPLKAARAAAALWKDGRAAAQSGGVSLLRIAWEQVLLYFLDNLNRQQYYTYALYDPALTWQEKRAFIANRNIKRYVDVLTPRRYEGLYRNKLAFSRVFSAAGVAVARLYGVFEPCWGAADDGSPLRNAAELADFVERRGIREFILKPVESERGLMVLPLRREGDALAAPGGRTLTWDDVVAHMSDESALRDAYPDDAVPPRAFLVEERLRPHPALAELTRETVCSARVITLVTLEGAVEVLGAVFKLPGWDRGTDNLSLGGVGVPVDIATGTLGEGFLYKKTPPTRFRAHPTTGKPFYGLRLPDWEAALELARQAALAFPQARVIGWDIGLTTRGPVVLEGNNDFGMMVTQQAFHRGMFQGVFRSTYLALTGKGGAPAPEQAAPRRRRSRPLVKV
jgi:hypothetical protein